MKLIVTITIERFWLDLVFRVKHISCWIFFSRLPDKDFYIISKLPPEQYFDCKIKTKEIGDKIKPLNENKIGIIVFDDFLGTPKNKNIDQFFKSGTQKILDIYYLSQSYFDLPKSTKRKNSTKIILFNQTLKDIKTYTETLVDMIWAIKNLKNYAWNQGKMSIDISVLLDFKREIKEDNVIVLQAKNTKIEGASETKPSWWCCTTKMINVVFN